MTINWFDEVQIVVVVDDERFTQVDVPFDQFRSRLMDDPYGVKEVRIDSILTGPSFFHTVPQGSLLRYIGITGTGTFTFNTFTGPDQALFNELLTEPLTLSVDGDPGTVRAVVVYDIPNILPDL